MATFEVFGDAWETTFCECDHCDGHDKRAAVVKRFEANDENEAARLAKTMHKWCDGHSAYQLAEIDPRQLETEFMRATCQPTLFY